MEWSVVQRGAPRAGRRVGVLEVDEAIHVRGASYPLQAESAGDRTDHRLALCSLEAPRPFAPNPHLAKCRCIRTVVQMQGFIKKIFD